MTQKTADQEIRRLQGSINDLISIQALPAIWNGRESGHIASTLLDVLVSMLRLDFAYARLSDSINGSPVEFVRSTQRRTAPPQPQEIGRALERWLTNQSRQRASGRAESSGRRRSQDRASPARAY